MPPKRPSFKRLHYVLFVIRHLAHQGDTNIEFQVLPHSSTKYFSYQTNPILFSSQGAKFMQGICEAPSARSALFRRVEWIITHSRRHCLRDVRARGGCADDDVRSRLRVLVQHQCGPFYRCSQDRLIGYYTFCNPIKGELNKKLCLSSRYGLLSCRVSFRRSPRRVA